VTRRWLPAPRESGAAVVTGASSGIGAAFALALARRGHRLVLVARREERLRAVAAEAEAAGARADVVALDLRDPGACRELPDRLTALGLEADVLVNSAGFGTWGRFAESDLEREVEQIRVNVEALTVVTRLLVPGMVARRAGAIVNVASSAALEPLPYLSVYAGCKAYVVSFSESLSDELRAAGVAVLAVNPGPVPTGFGEVSGLAADREPAPQVSAERVVAESLRALERGRRTLIPGRRMRATMLATRLAPSPITRRIVERSYRPDG
jgi:short-subunit dehydrogenase